MNITFRQMNVFLAVAQFKSITAAAEACHVTQPTVSMQMKELTESIGLPLYEQIGKRLHLTEAGETLVESAQAMTEEWNRFEQTIEAMKGHKKGRLRVAVASTAKYFVPRILGEFCHAYPEVDISLEVLNRDGVVQRLRDNADDLYIMSIPPEDVAVEKQAFMENPLVVIAPLNHPLANQTGLNLKSLENESFVLRERGSGTRLACNRHFEEQQFKPKVRLELGSNEAIKHAVAGDLGLGVISSHALSGKPENEGLAVLDVETFPIHANWWLLYLQGKKLSPIAKEFITYLQATPTSS